MNAFHAYDIRGIYNQDFDKNDVYKVGFFLPKLLKTDKVLIGRDVRISSPEVYEYLCKGICDAGADVYDAGLCTTPMVYWFTAKFGFDASVMITASHNGKEYNGLKISRTGAKPVGYETGLGELEKMMQGEIVVNTITGKVINFDKTTEYIRFQKNYVPKDFSNLNISIDCSNGMAGLIIRDIIGDNHNYIYDTLDGSFPNHEANPLVQKNTVDIRKAVVKNKSDIGIIFDGDADRVMFIDEKGEFISPDLLIAAMGHYFIKKDTPRTKVLQDIRSSKAVGEYLAKLGLVEMYTWKVGRAFASLKLDEIGALYGGELAGHYYFEDFYHSDSAMMAMSIILDVVIEMKKQGISVSQLISNIKAYSNSGEINYKIDDKSGAMEMVKSHFETTENISKLMDFDGYRLEFEDWWFNIRPSNTEPYLRLIVEAKEQPMLDEKLKIIDEIIRSKM
ncbi:MAG: phosphomannomutase/phosphoglucomutase [Bacteroidales bacterium]|nr:phosphomannomutase/phosphoglucomutase [Bacteroidales bacterium]